MVKIIIFVMSIIARHISSWCINDMVSLVNHDKL